MSKDTVTSRRPQVFSNLEAEVPSALMGGEVSEIIDYVRLVESDLNKAMEIIRLYVATATESAKLLRRGKKKLDLADIDDMARAFLNQVKP